MGFYDLGKLSIMVVDDDPNTIALMSDVLSALGTGAVVAAPNGNVAQAMLADPRQAAVDLVFTDYEMGPGDGADLLHWIRHDPQSPDRYVPVVLMSAHGDMDTLRRMRELGVNDFLAKPISLDSLCRLLGNLFGASPDFVEIGQYFGPDRRRRDMPYRGGERRDLAEEHA